MRSVRKDTPQFYSPAARYIASQLYYASHSFIVLRTVSGEKITLKPQGFNITFDLSKISLQILFAISHIHTEENIFRLTLLHSKHITHYDTFKPKVSVFIKNWEHFITKCLPINFICP